MILGLRVLRGIRKSPLTGGAEALLRHTGRGGGDAETDGGAQAVRHFGETKLTGRKDGRTLRKDWGIWK